MNINELITDYSHVQNTPEDMFDKVIHITYKNIEKLENVKNQWLMLNPEYRVELYDDTRCITFLNEYFGAKFGDIFNYIQDGPIKSDFFRICVLYIYGGVYVDADIKPFIPLNEFIEDDIELCTVISYNYQKEKTVYNYNPHFIVAKKRNNYLYDTIKKYELLYEQQSYSYWHWSICNLFNINDLEYNINNEKNAFTLNDKKYMFLIEKVVGPEDILYDFTNLFDENKQQKFKYSKYVFCDYDGKKVLENFTNKGTLL